MLRHAATAGHGLEEEDKVQSTISTLQGRGHHPSTCPKPPHGWTKVSSMQGMHATKHWWSLDPSGAGSKWF